MRGYRVTLCGEDDGEHVDSRAAMVTFDVLATDPEDAYEKALEKAFTTWCGSPGSIGRKDAYEFGYGQSGEPPDSGSHPMGWLEMHSCYHADELREAADTLDTLILAT